MATPACLLGHFKMRDYPVIERTVKVNSKGWVYWNTKDIAKELGASDDNRGQAELKILLMKGMVGNWENTVFERKSSLSLIRWPMMMFVMFLEPENEDIQRMQLHLAIQTEFNYVANTRPELELNPI